MPKHIARLVFLIVAFLVVAVFAKSFFTSDSFYRYGHYRADSVPEIAGMATSFQTPKACIECHAPRHAEWSGGVHKTVICEVCHGAAPGHPATLKVVIPTDTPRLCTQCHEKMPGRPATSIRQIDPRQHYPDAGQCIACHDPHSPRIAPAGTPAAFDHKAATAGIATCVACHGGNGIATNPAWPNLAGQNAAYLSRALGSFKTGIRKNETMAPMAQTVADEDIRNITAYYGSLACRTSGAALPPAKVAAAKALARQCASCHGENGKPVNTAWPRLAGQNAAYLESSLAAFREGQRENAFMSPAAKSLAPADVVLLASYYASLNCSGQPQ